MLTGSCSQRAPRSSVGHNSETNGPQQVTYGGGVQPCLAWLGYLLNQETDFLCRGLELMKELTSQGVAGKPLDLTLTAVTTIYALILYQAQRLSHSINREVWPFESVTRSIVSDSATPQECGPPGSSVRGILQARILEWVAFPFSNGSSPPTDRTQISAIQADSLPSEPKGLAHYWGSIKICGINEKLIRNFTTTAAGRGVREELRFTSSPPSDLLCRHWGCGDPESSQLLPRGARG